MRQAYLGADFWSRNIDRDRASAVTSCSQLSWRKSRKPNENIRILTVSLMIS